MKRVLAILLVMVLGLMMLAGCGSGTANDGAATDNGNSTPPVEETVELPPFTVDMTADEMWASYQELSDATSLSDITYDVIAGHFGVEGKLSEEMSSETNNWYEWYSNDGGGLVFLFNKETGKFASASKTEPS